MKIKKYISFAIGKPRHVLQFFFHSFSIEGLFFVMGALSMFLRLNNLSIAIEPQIRKAQSIWYLTLKLNKTLVGQAHYSTRGTFQIFDITVHTFHEGKGYARCMQLWMAKHAFFFGNFQNFLRKFWKLLKFF